MTASLKFFVDRKRTLASEGRPSADRLPEVLMVAARHARIQLADRGLPVPDEDAEVVGLHGGALSR